MMLIKKGPIQKFMAALIANGIILYLSESFFADVAHIDVAGRPVFLVPIILGALPVFAFLYWGRSRKETALWKEILVDILCIAIMLAIDLVVLIMWSCDRGVCI